MEVPAIPSSLLQEWILVEKSRNGDCQKRNGKSNRLQTYNKHSSGKQLPSTLSSEASSCMVNMVMCFTFDDMGAVVSATTTDVWATIMRSSNNGATDSASERPVAFVPRIYVIECKMSATTVLLEMRDGCS